MQILNFKPFAFMMLILSFQASVWAQSSTPLVPIIEVFSPPAPADPSQFMKIAVIQSNPSIEAPVGAPKANIVAYMASNRDAMKIKIEEARTQGAQFIVLSEFAVVGYPDIPELPSEEDEFRTREDIKEFVDTIPGVSTAYFSAVAQANKVWIQFGMAEHESVTDKYFNAVVVINDLGEIVSSYRKNTLYQMEHNFLSPGQDPVIIDSPMGKIGLVICADIYNDQLLNKYKTLGAQILSLSTSWASMNSGMGNFSRAAKAYSMYVLAANQNYFPDSGVVNPDGTTQSHIRQSRDSIAYGYIPLLKRNESLRPIHK